MQKITFVIAMLLINLTVSAQDFVHYRDNGTITLKDSSIIEGDLYYSLSYPGHVRLVQPGRDDKLRPEEMIGFQIGDMVFKTILAKDAISLTGKGYMFARLLNPDCTKIQVYKSETQAIIAVNNNAEITTSYYVFMPEVGQALPVGDLKFMPSRKIAKYVTQCPDLASKLASKDKDYSVGMISSDQMRVNLFLKIAREYEACK